MKGKGGIKNMKKIYRISLSKILTLNPSYTAIHCNTEEKANKLLTILNKLGKKWVSGKSYLEDNYWRFDTTETCYGLDGSYGISKWYDNVYEFEEVDLDN